MRSLVLLGFGLLLLVDSMNGSYDPTFTGPASQIVNLGDQANLTLTSNDATTVVWTHMNSDSTVAVVTNRSVAILGDSTLYSGGVEARSDEQLSYRLTVVVSLATFGVYRCNYTSASNSSVFYFSVLINSTLSKDVAPGEKNFTECCQSKHVSASCLPACSTAVFATSFNFSQCAGDKNLAGLRHCTMNGRNHIHCCQQRGLTGRCLELCVKGDVAGGDLSSCGKHTKDLLLCFYEGQMIIPSPPRTVYVQILSRSSVFVYWTTPAENNAFVDGYQVFYKATKELEYKSKHVSQSTSSLKLNGLAVNQKYTVYVQATSRHGSSHRSNLVMASLLDEFFYVHNGTETVDACCKKHGVSDKCRAQLCVGIPKEVGLVDVLTCIKDWPRIVKCFAGGRDHTACCSAADVRASCLKYCSGREADTSHSELDCMTSFRKISMCFNSGVKKIPSAPLELRMINVFTTSITLDWEAPKTLGDPLSTTVYYVLYRNVSAGEKRFYKMKTYYTFAKLTELSAGTDYEISVVASNAIGSSLPSSTIRVVTHTSPAIKLDAQKPYDPKKCCKDNGVSEKCQEACDLTKSISYVPESCKSYTMKMAHCLADGRDHSYCCRNDPRVHSRCYGLCTLDKAGSASVETSVIWGCMVTSSFTGLRRCFAEGHKLLPSAPRFLRLLELKHDTAKIQWTIPARHPKVFGFRVYYTTGKDSKVKKLTSVRNITTIHLKDNAEYSVHVTAVAKDGYQSLPSNSIGFRTLPVLSADWYKHKDPNFDSHNVSTCCVKKGVSSACQPLCNADDKSTLLWTPKQAQKCVADLSKVIPCAADKRDHTACCQGRRVPHFCLPLCRGSATVSITSSAVCVQFIPEVRSCFLEGYETLPAPPIVQEVAPSHSSVSIKFTEPLSNRAIPGVINYLYYQRTGSKEDSFWRVVQNVSSPMLLTRLSSLTTYSVFLVAVSTNGTSLPSAIFNVTTYAHAPFSVYVIASPSTKVRRGVEVTLTCVVPGLTTPPSRVWYHQATRLASTNGVWRKNVTRADSGYYVCVATALGANVTRKVFLIVQSTISVFSPRKIVRASLYSTITVECTFVGFPDTVQWSYKKEAGSDDKVLLGSKNQIIETSTDRHYTVSKLTLVGLSASSYGYYICTGKNAIDQASASVFVTDPSYTGSVPTLAPPTSSTRNHTECCRRSSVSPACVPACDFAVDESFYSRQPACIYEFNSIQQCLTDGSNHTKCCQKSGVPSQCWSLCAGSAPRVDRAFFNCFQPDVVKKTSACMKEAAKVLPSEPLAPKVTSNTSSSFSVEWNRPAMPGTLPITYEVEYKDLDIKKSETAETSNRFYTARGLPGGHSYRVRVRAKNARGSSGYTPPFFTCTVGVPPAPINIHGKVIAGVTVKLSWEMPPFSVVKVTGFLVHWRQGEKKMVNRTSGNTKEKDFPCLQPNSTFFFQVVAENGQGNSTRSEEEKVVTTANKNPYCAKTKKTVTRHVHDMRGVVVVILLLLFLVIGIVAIVFFIYYNRGNPNYAWPTWLRRLPFMRPARERVSMHEFDNPVRFSNMGDDEEQQITLDGLPSQADGNDGLASSET